MSENTGSHLIERSHYMDILRDSRDSPFIKILTGIRRCGKSTLLSMFRMELLKSGVPEGRMFRMDFDVDSTDIPHDHRALTDLVESSVEVGPGTCIFLDEVQNVHEWERSVASFYTKGADVYITGSNSQMLSSELSTKLSGRCLEIYVMPLVFSEYVRFRKIQDIDRLLDDYIRDGGLPAVALAEDDSSRSIIPQIIEGTFNTVFVKDVIQRHSVRNVQSMMNLFRFMMRNIGDRTSARNAANYLTSSGIKTNHVTIEDHIGFLEEAFLVSRARRYDSKTKEYLVTSDKFYSTDLGVRNNVAGLRYYEDLDGIVENIVYQELRYRYGHVAVLSVDNLEVDFVSDPIHSPMYWQVSLNIGDANTRERELRSLEAIPDNYPKTIITYDRFPMDDIDGIRVVQLRDWLMEGR